MKLTSISSRTGWVFVHKGNADEEVEHPIAAWGLTEDGNVVGLVAVSGGGDDAIMPGTCRLVEVPPVKGTYRQVV